jgi:hypothetical protein
LAPVSSSLIGETVSLKALDEENNSAGAPASQVIERIVLKKRLLLERRKGSIIGMENSKKL